MANVISFKKRWNEDMTMETIKEFMDLKPVEWLTTGQMIDSLKVGECAECINVPGIAGMKKSVSYQVKKVNEGHIKWCDGHMDTLIMSCFIVSEAKWRIIPQFVSFEEAMKADSKGKTVYFHPEENTRLSFHRESLIGNTWLNDYSFKQLFEGKWTIEGE
jgi:hypothetical protein